MTTAAAAGPLATEAAFVRAICERPGDDLPRLAFADWLDEHDQPERADLIRVQIELASIQDGRGDDWHLGDGSGKYPCGCRACRLMLRAASLLDDPDVKEECWAGLPHAPGWHRTADGWLCAAPQVELVFRRGMVAEIRLPLAAFLAHAADLFAAHPVERVVISDAVVHPSGGNDTYYLGGLGRFPREYWRRLDGLPSRRAVLEAVSAVCVHWGRTLANLPPLG